MEDERERERGTRIRRLEIICVMITWTCNVHREKWERERGVKRQGVAKVGGRSSLPSSCKRKETQKYRNKIWIQYERTNACSLSSQRKWFIYLTQSIRMLATAVVMMMIVEMRVGKKKKSKTKRENDWTLCACNVGCDAYKNEGTAIRHRIDRFTNRLLSLKWTFGKGRKTPFSSILSSVAIKCR